MPDTRGNLLIVDDDASVRSSLVLIFSALGYCARASDDGYLALWEIGKQIPDVLLFDLNMVLIPGLEFLRVIRRSFPSIRVIAMSGIFSDKGMAPEVAADAFHQKGAGPSRLIEYVDALTQPMRPLSRLSADRSVDRQVFEPIPAHPGTELHTYPVKRFSGHRAQLNELGCELIPMAKVTPFQEACSQ